MLLFWWTFGHWRWTLGRFSCPALGFWSQGQRHLVSGWRDRGTGTLSQLARDTGQFIVLDSRSFLALLVGSRARVFLDFVEED